MEKEIESTRDLLLNREECKEESKNSAKRRKVFQIRKVNESSQEGNSRKAKRSCPETSNTQCVICYQTIKTQGTIDTCKHEFCIVCIKHWSEVSWTLTLD